ncbi:hypothetical protein MGMO_14c00090 [Methyloglobulus morosus KoM1]|uniref:PepSY domain-containing protein n=1 Tax=Methyloglobulus morosus KoM1 TaxID=1116472 RepID=V5CA26_9GAMM|nr:hypothetical protein [Methyloglobulus morosus]ESS73653.1 hypothetical protein MGMO_14c00090 [Methyloglobulus morosus KoM1]
MEFGRCLLIFVTSFQVAAADTNDTDRYALPPSKVNIEPCKNEALILHPGAIDKERMLLRYGKSWVEYVVQARDGSEWLVLCDLSTGKVNREQELIDE